MSATENWRDRCDWCGWPLDPEEKMCRATDCSMRPRPERADTALRQECRKAEAELAALRSAVESARAEERARCAKIAEDMEGYWERRIERNPSSNEHAAWSLAVQESRNIAAAIRATGKAAETRT